MFLKDLFERDNVKYPKWIPKEFIFDDWKNSTYLKGENLHKWELNLDDGFRTITYTEDESCIFESYNLENQLLFEKIITPEEISIS